MSRSEFSCFWPRPLYRRTAACSLSRRGRVLLTLRRWDYRLIEILFCGEASGCCFGFGVVLLGMRPRLEVFGHRDPSRLLDALLKTTRCEKE